MFASAQILILVLLVVGWGYWTWRLLCGGRSMFPFSWLFARLAGYVGQLIILDTTARLGVPVHVSAWPILALAAVGGTSAVGALRQWRTASSSGACKEFLATVSVFAVVVAAQCAGLLHQGPQNYYGKGRTDQLAWVLLGQYLLEKGSPYHTPDIERHPWTLKAGAMRGQRMTPAVANAELAIASWSDVKSAYGVQSVLLAALLPV